MPDLAATKSVTVARTTLGDAVVVLGSRTNSSIGISEPDLARLPVPILSPTLPLRTALTRLLRGSPACLRRIDVTSYTIVRCPAVPRAPAPPAVIPHPPVERVITITASKRRLRMADYPGAADMVMLGGTVGTGGDRGTDALVARLPLLTATNLGIGRNKLFIRGVADSSFNGPTQATVGQYFNDVRLNYNAPDPDLTLYDVDRTEVLEGPQGTLYGIGSLGGIVRIVPNAVRLDRSEVSADVGLSSTADGAGSSDIAAMLNVPLAIDRIALRAVAYRSIDGGYIDDVERGLSDVNRTRTIGGRLAVRAELGDRWRIEANGILQNIDSRDGQYAERPLHPFQRRSAAAQPFDNDYSVGSITVTKTWDRLSLTSISSATRHLVDTTFDFTPAGSPVILFTQDNHIALFSSEMRLSRAGADGAGWLVGTSLVLDDERLTRTLGAAVSPAKIAGVRNLITDGAAFGEFSFRRGGPWLVTIGSRLSYTHLGGEGLDEVPGSVKDEPTRQELRILPSLAVSRRSNGGAVLFGRLQQGFRPGGLAVTGDFPKPIVQRFQGDVISTAELGIRTNEASGRLKASATLSFAMWNHIQADLVADTGLPFTTNIGNGRIIALDGRVSWQLLPGLNVEGGIFVNESELTEPAPAFVGSKASQLPNTPPIGARIALDYIRSITPRWTISARGSVRYVGRSRLGVGPVLNISQGNYMVASSTARLGSDRLGISLAVTNLTNVAANTFSLGNPFTVAQRLQSTPVRPRTARLGVDLRF